MSEHEVNIPRVSVTFTRSSTKDGGRGYTVQVQEGATKEEVDRVMQIAEDLQRGAERVIAGDDA